MSSSMRGILKQFLFAASVSAIAVAQTGTVTSVSAANYRAVVAPNSIISGWGTGATLSATTVAANTMSVNNQPVSLPTSLGSTTIAFKDSANASLNPVLYLVSPGQINYVIPQSTALGKATLTVNSGGNAVVGPVYVSNVSPALFTADASGTGVPVGSVLRVPASGAATVDNPYQSGSSTFMPKPINLSSSPSDKVYLILYGTGVRNRSLNPATATIGGVLVPVQYAGPQSQYPGFDQINLGPLPQSIVGKGNTDLIVNIDGVPSNTVRIAIQ